jgi:hypothetical protein
MGVLIAAALPVLPGQSDRVRSFDSDLEPHREEWERLNREATVTRYSTFLQESPQGDVALVVMQVDDPTKIRSTFTDSAYDTWWLDYLRDVHGLDLRSMSPEDYPAAATPVQIWEAKA